MNGGSFSSCGNCSIPPCFVYTSNCSNSSQFGTTSDVINEQDKSHMSVESLGLNDGPMDASTTALEKQTSRDDFVFQHPNQHRLPTKRLRVSDINVSRYEEEFVEIEEIASGVFGKVMVARHRLDGMVYAVKVC